MRGSMGEATRVNGSVIPSDEGAESPEEPRDPYTGRSLWNSIGILRLRFAPRGGRTPAQDDTVIGGFCPGAKIKGFPSHS